MFYASLLFALVIADFFAQGQHTPPRQSQIHPDLEVSDVWRPRRHQA